VLGAAGLGFALYKSTSGKKKSSNGKSKVSTISSMLSGQTSQQSKASSSTTNKDFDMKGYKTNSKGQKTTYFNRELSEEEKQLIGDITPKKIEPGAPAQSMSPQRLASPSAGGSAWNQAGTWEEKNVTEWAADNLTLLLRITEHTLPPSHSGKITITSVQKVEGDATVSMIRGKKKYLYDLNTSVRWKLEADDVEASGDLVISEISADATHEFCVQSINIVATSGQSRKKANDHIKNFVHSETDSLKSSVSNALESFYNDMKTKF